MVKIVAAGCMTPLGRRLSELGDALVAGQVAVGEYPREGGESAYAASLGEFKAQNLANMAWAFAAADLPDEPLLKAWARMMDPLLDHVKMQELSNVAWSFATVEWSVEPLFAALARVAERRLWELNSQGLANTAWAFVIADLLEELLYVAMARAVGRRLSQFGV